ncbi:MAG TPA: DNA ligase-associated DEXH box helicase, partial [Chitinophagales bacterium]|nr:DNA ligase-associated DEXH box helicase [Chitinophagales bacterium]
GRMPLSSYMADMMRKQLGLSAESNLHNFEYTHLQPLLDLQRDRSAIPAYDTILVETAESKEGLHIFIYPFEGRVVHEVLAGLIAFRISKKQELSISVAMNDYGFELLCNHPVEINESVIRELFEIKGLDDDVFQSVNATEMARRKFRDISVISGMVFQGYPGEQKRARDLQSSAQLIFDVLRKYEPSNLLIKQAYDEILNDQMENARLRTALLRISKSKILIKHTDRFSPFAFPIVVDDLSRNKLTSESLASRIQQMLRENK